MNVRPISPYKINFGKYQKPDTKVQDKINTFIKDVKSDELRDFLTDEYVRMVKEQKDNAETTIRFILDSTGKGVQVQQSRANSYTNSGIAYDFPSLVEKMQSVEKSLNWKKNAAVDKAIAVFDED